MNQELLLHQKSEIMKRVTLYTVSGETVTDVYLPDVLPHPKVILWGVWCFVWREQEGDGGQYREASIVYLPADHPLPTSL